MEGRSGSVETGLPVVATAGWGNEAPAVNGPWSETVAERVILKLIKLHVANRPEKLEGFNPAANVPKEKFEPTTGQSEQQVKEETQKTTARELKEEEEEAAPEPVRANRVPAPACTQQGPNSFTGKLSPVPHAVYEGK